MTCVERALWALQVFGDYQSLISAKAPETRGAGLYYKALALVTHDRCLDGRIFEPRPDL